MDAVSIVNKAVTFIRTFYNSKKWNAKGVISRIGADCTTEKECQWLPTAAWDATHGVEEIDGSDSNYHLLKISEGRVIIKGLEQAVFTRSGFMLGAGASWYWKEGERYDLLEDHPFYCRKWYKRPFKWIPEPECYRSPLLILNYHWADCNYYHLMIDLVPAIMLWRSNSASGSGAIVIGRLSRLSFSQEVLRRIGLSVHQFAGRELIHIQTSLLYVIARVRHSNDVASQATRCLRQIFAQEIDNRSDIKVEQFTKILIRRGASSKRILHNEDSLSEALAEQGFQEVWLEHMSVSTQAQLFSRARIVIGQHGSGLTNIIFCKPETAVIELHGNSWYYTMYRQLAERCELRYLSVECKENPDLSLIADINRILCLSESF